MIFALFTAVSYPMSAIFARKLTGVYGSQRANLYRLVLAALILGGLTFALFPGSFHPTTFTWLFVSGVIGFGVGDVALFYAYMSIGSRLTVLMNFSLATIFGLLTEFLWLGTGILAVEMLAIAVVLAGLSVAVLSTPASHMKRQGSHTLGLIAAVVAGFGQGVGAVISRHATDLGEGLGLGEINGISQAFQRVLAGVLFAAVVVAFLNLRKRNFRQERHGGSGGSDEKSVDDESSKHRNPLWKLSIWMLGAAAFGPVIGVSCFQAALADLPSGIVLAIVASSPIVVIPLAYLFEGDRPTWLSCLGGVIGAAGVAWICILRG